LRLPLHFGKP